MRYDIMRIYCHGYRKLLTADTRSNNCGQEHQYTTTFRKNTYIECSKLYNSTFWDYIII